MAGNKDDKDSKDFKDEEDVTRIASLASMLSLVLGSAPHVSPRHINGPTIHMERLCQDIISLLADIVDYPSHIDSASNDIID